MCRIERPNSRSPRTRNHSTCEQPDKARRMLRYTEAHGRTRSARAFAVEKSHRARRFARKHRGGGVALWIAAAALVASLAMAAYVPHTIAGSPLRRQLAAAGSAGGSQGFFNRLRRGSKRERANHVATVCGWRPSTRAVCTIVRPWRSKCVSLFGNCEQERQGLSRDLRGLPRNRDSRCRRRIALPAHVGA